MARRMPVLLIAILAACHEPDPLTQLGTQIRMGQSCEQIRADFADRASASPHLRFREFSASELSPGRIYAGAIVQWDVGFALRHAESDRELAVLCHPPSTVRQVVLP